MAAKKLVKSLVWGLISLISSQTPTPKVIVAAKRIPMRCLSIGRKNNEVNKTPRKMEIPPPRGMVEIAVALPVFFVFLPDLQANGEK